MLCVCMHRSISLAAFVHRPWLAEADATVVTTITRHRCCIALPLGSRYMDVPRYRNRLPPPAAGQQGERDYNSIKLDANFTA